MLTLLFATAVAADWSPGQAIDPALVADITPEGFDAIGDLIPALLPSDIAIPDMGDDQGYYAYSLTNGKVQIQVTDAKIAPGAGVLDVTASMNVGVNTAGDPFELYLSALWIFEDTCPGYVQPFPVDVHTTMALQVVDDGSGGNKLDATMGAIDVSYELSGDDIHMDCTIDDINSVLEFFGLSLYDLIIDQLDATLQDQIASLGPTLESTIEDAFASATISQDIDLNGAVAHLELQPTDVQITPDAARILLGGSMSAEQSECVRKYDPNGSLKTASASPDIGEHPSDVPAGYDAVVDVSDDFANQALYALWRGGLLCYELGPDGSIPLDTSILAALVGDAYDDVIPEAVPLTIVTRPQAPPTVDYLGSHDIGLAIRTLGLDMYAEVDGRQARLVGLNLDADAGIDLTFDDKTGNLGIGVAFDSSAITPSVAYNELAAEANDKFVSGFGTLFDSVAGSLLGGLTDGLAFALPAFNGVGLGSIQIAPNGANKDWLGAFAGIGIVTYSGDSSCGGCGGDTGAGADTGGGGCGSSGCSTVPGSSWGLAPLAALVLLRRRR